MGSYFLHDDYRLPEIASFSFKKESNGNTNTGIFENNPCFANIKKELGFYDEVAPSSSGQADGRSEYFPDTRARSSPAVERLILQEIQSDIVDYAAMLNIPIDPEQWSMADARTWLMWLSKQYQIPNLPDCLGYEGPTLCNMSEQELILLTGSRDNGLKVSAQLDIWKNACRMVPSAGFYHFQQQQAMDQRFCNDSRAAAAPGQRLMASSCSWTMPPNTQPPNQLNSYQPVNYQQINSYPAPNTPSRFMRQNTSPAVESRSFANGECSNYPHPTIPLNRFHSQRSVPATATYPRTTPPQELFRRTMSDSFMPEQNVPTFISPPQPLKEDFTDTKNEVTKPDHKHEPNHYSSCVASKSTSEDDLDSGGPSATDQPQKFDKVAQDLEQSRPDKEAVGQNKLSQRKPSKHPIHLWEFLKQLLHEKRDCIQWVDEERGVFKIFNSQQVAKYWGERKNRPAMNYDKLSRSIRQYYKKGIIKKTSQGKRLVYQFCEPYL